MYPLGKFTFVNDFWTRHCFEKTFEIITNIDGAWEFLNYFEPHKDLGFMLTAHPILSKISDASENEGLGHSGASWGMTMRHMELIAKKGWHNYVVSCL